MNTDKIIIMGKILIAAFIIMILTGLILWTHDSPCRFGGKEHQDQQEQISNEVSRFAHTFDDDKLPFSYAYSPNGKYGGEYRLNNGEKHIKCWFEIEIGMNKTTFMEDILIDIRTN